VLNIAVSSFHLSDTASTRLFLNASSITDRLSGSRPRTATGRQPGIRTGRHAPVQGVTTRPTAPQTAPASSRQSRYKIERTWVYD
jgi:hypothetical protein